MPVRDLNTLMRSFVHADGAWARCNRCSTADPKAAYWGLFRDDAVILAKAQKHMAKVHAPKAPQGAEAAAQVPEAEFSDHANFVPDLIAELRQPDPDKVCVHNVDLFAECSKCLLVARDHGLIDQAMADIQSELEIARR